MISKPETEGWLGKYSHNQFHNYQIEEYNEALKFVKQFRTAIDLGGNLGIMSNRMVKNFEFVHAFEPLFHKYLRSNIKEKNIQVYPYAVGDTPGTVTMRVGFHHSGGSNIVDREADGKGLREVEVVTVDSFDIKDVDFIKIDVEDYEWFALQGAKNTIEKYKPVLLIELKDDNTYHRNIIIFLEQLGYIRKRVGDIDSVFYTE